MFQTKEEKKVSLPVATSMPKLLDHFVALISYLTHISPLDYTWTLVRNAWSSWSFEKSSTKVKTTQEAKGGGGVEITLLMKKLKLKIITQTSFILLE